MNNFPKIHNATWPGLVGKGPDSEPVISLDQMLQMTAKAEVDGIKFDGVDLGYWTHILISTVAKKVLKLWQTKLHPMT